MNINEALAKIKAWDPEVFKLVKNNLKSRNYGLVYERNLPDAVCLWNKQLSKFDKVYCLPPRGKVGRVKLKNGKYGDILPEYSTIWHVANIDDDVVSLVNDTDTITVDRHNVVPVVEPSDVIYPGLQFVDKIENGEKDSPYHVLINAENYHALEMLRYAYAGKVDCIYIDPPYNTGANDWKYNNDYVGKTDEYRHSKWLMFMERRLRLAKDLLNPDNSVLIVTIDEKEYLRLGMLLEQMFPEARIQMISSIISRKGIVRADEFSRNNEFIYFVRFGNLKFNSISSVNYIKQGNEIHWQTLRRSNKSNTRDKTFTQFYPIYVDIATNKIVKVGLPLTPSVDRYSVESISGCETVFPIREDGTEMMWGIQYSLFLEYLKKGYVRATKYNKDSYQKFVIQYLMKGTVDDIKLGKIDYKYDEKLGYITGNYIFDKKVIPSTVWDFDSHDARDYGNKILNNFILDCDFLYPKSLYAVEDCLRLVVGDENHKDALIVDFFAGSGTTAHATMLLNHLDGGHRRCISITNNEVGSDAEEEFIKQGLRPTDKAWQDKGIAKYITWERIKAAITGIAPNGEPIDGNYKFTEEFPMSEGFKENAIFFDLTYENLWDIKLDRAFNAVAPILWMTAGCKGPIIEKLGKGYATTDYYAVLFKFSALNKLVEVLKDKPTIEHVFAVTNDNDRFAIIQHKLTMIKPQNIHRLYESYLSSFEIVAEGGLD